MDVKDFVRPSTITKAVGVSQGMIRKWCAAGVLKEGRDWFRIPASTHRRISLKAVRRVLAERVQPAA